MITQKETLVASEDAQPILHRVSLPPLAWYGGSWAYDEPEPEPTPVEIVPPPPAKWEPQHLKAKDFGPDLGPDAGHGVILGRFLPPHAGHTYVVDFARSFTKLLTIFVRAAPEDEIPGEKRVAWLREMFPGVKVVQVNDAPPLIEAGESSVRERWAWLVQQLLPQPKYLFASESYGPELALRLGARYVPVDPARRIVPVRGRQIRANPSAYWAYLPPPVRAHYVRRVCLIGPEATGKTTLAERLAARFNTLCTEEYARTWSSLARNFEWQPADTQIIAQGQRALTELLAARAYRVLFCDTDLLAVSLWCERIFGAVPAWLEKLARQEVCDLYLVTRPDVPYNGPARFDQPAQRQAFYERIVRELTERKLPFREISGAWETRFEQACQAVEEIKG